MTRTNLSDRTLKALKPAPPGSRYDKRDEQVPGLIVRVTDKGTRTFMLQARFTSAAGPVRRSLGIYPELSLEKARIKARAWRTMLKEGVDPAQAEAAQRLAQQRMAANTFAAVADAFVAEITRRGQRKAREVERDLQREFVSRWGKQPVTSITALDVKSVIDAAKARDAPYQAHNLLGTVRRLFDWAIDQGTYGLETSPCDRLRPKSLIGKKKPRQRVLSDSELRAFWRATAEIDYPYGPLFRLLLLTVLRKNEVAEAVWSEFDLAKRLWAIPAPRMKAEFPHLVLLPPAAFELISGLPRFNSGPHIFTTTGGRKPVNGFSKAKVRLDALMRRDCPDLQPWIIHDLRRTGRTHLSGFPSVTYNVAELVIAHARKGLDRVYDQYAYLDEKRRALELWADRVDGIVNPLQATVSPLHPRAQ